MRLITQLSILLEEDQPWYEEALHAENLEDLEDLLKLFGSTTSKSMYGLIYRGEAQLTAMRSLYKALEQRGLGDQFLTHILNSWEDDIALSIVLDAIGGSSNADKDLLYKYVIPYAIDAFTNITYVVDDGKYTLELMPGEEASFFRNNGTSVSNCEEIARQIWGDMGLDWEPFHTNTSLDYLLENEMNEEALEGLKQHIVNEYTNAEVSSSREEFDDWKKEDRIGEDADAFFLYPERIMNLDPYNLAVLLDSAEDLEEVKNEIKWSWDEAWNQGIMDNYYTTYHDAFYENIGKSLGTRTIKKSVWSYKKKVYASLDVEIHSYDVTSIAERIILDYIDSGGDVRDSDFVDVIIEADSVFPLCPHVDDYPDDDDEVTEIFNERIKNYL